jgi:hypothetical protein
MDEITVQGWDEFIDLTSSLDGWAFRGHRHARWQLSSSLSRYLGNFIPEREAWTEREKRAIRIFRRKAHNYLTNEAVLQEDLRTVALMQHHGAPTRLLDFTKSPFVAAFFALERAIGASAVYALNTPALWHAAPRERPELTRDVIDPRQPGKFEHYFIQNAHEVVWVGEPMQMDRRLVAQSGMFAVPGVLDRPLDQILDGYDTDEALIRKIVLPASMREEAMRTLYRMNITHATLFPDLDGLARSLAFELEMVWSGSNVDPEQGRLD